jgi:hypothetical protein
MTTQYLEESLKEVGGHDFDVCDCCVALLTESNLPKHRMIQLSAAGVLMSDSLSAHSSLLPT